MKQIVQSQSVLQLYLASQQKIYKNLSKEDLLDIEKHKLINIKPTQEVLTDEDMQDYKKEYYSLQRVFSQMTLGYRYNIGIQGLPVKC